MSSTVSTATPPFADLAEDAVGVAVDAVERRAVEGGAETLRALVRAEEMEARVRVFGEHEAGEQPRRLLRLRGLWRGRCEAIVRGARAIAVAVLAAVQPRLLAVPILLEGAGLDRRVLHRLEIHLSIGAVQEWELARQAVR
jgi:hypothetical protein